MANINNELNRIRNAIYGEDMRSAIHDAIEKVNEDTESINADDISYDATNQYEEGTVGYNLLGTQTELNEVKDFVFSGYPTSSITGRIAHITDGANDIPVKQLTLTMQSTQDGSGDPSTDNRRNINGFTGIKVTRCGKNTLEPFQYEANGVKTEPQTDGTMRAHGKTIRQGNIVTYKTVAISETDFIIGDTFTISCGANVGFSIRFFDSLDPANELSRTTSASDGNPVTGSIPIGTVYLRFVCQFGTAQFAADEAVDITSWFQIEHGDTFTNYEPYQGKTYSVEFSTEIGTVAEGTYDARTGMLDATRIIETYNGSETWTVKGSNDSGFVCSVPLTKPKLSANSVTSEIVSNMFGIVGNNSITNPSMTKTGIPSAGGDQNTAYFYLQYDFIADITAWKTWLASNNVQISYLLKDPIQIRIDKINVHTLLGLNYIFTNCNNMAVTYRTQPASVSDSEKEYFGEYLTAWERGGFYASTGGNSSSYNYAIRTPFIEVTDNPLYIECDEGYSFILFNQNYDDSKISSTQWVTEAVSDINAANIRIMLRIDNDTTTPGDVSNSKHIRIWKIKQDSTFDSVLSGMGLAIKNMYKNLQPVATWIDDNNGTSAEMTALSTLLDELSDSSTNRMKISLAVDCSKLNSIDTYMNDLKAFQDAGCHIANHGSQWQDWIDHYQEGSSYNPDICEKVVINGNAILQSNGFLESDYFIYPGGHTDTELDKRVKKWCKCGVLAGASNGICHLAGSGRFRLKRCFIRVQSSMGDTSAEDTLTRIKGYIDLAVANNDWIIFGTHSGTASEFNASLVTSVINYAKQKGLTFKTLNEAYKEREWLFKLSEILS